VRVLRIAILAFSAPLILLAARADSTPAADSDEPYAPHTPTLIFYLSGATGPRDSDSIHASVQKLKSASVVEVNTTRSYTRVRFDSHVVSYHQVAQAISDAGTALKKNYDPYLVFTVSGYNLPNNAARVDALFARKRLNQRVMVMPLDKSKGMFAIHFHPLEIDPGATGPQGFNGGNLHHPISDPPPRGLALVSAYASTDVLLSSAH
jgi:hypothetical protein